MSEKNKVKEKALQLTGEAVDIALNSRSGESTINLSEIMGATFIEIKITHRNPKFGSLNQ